MISYKLIPIIMTKVFFIIGPSSSGKTKISKFISNKLHINFLEGDDFHPKANINMMKRGKALSDRNRMPWISSLNKYLVNKDQKFIVSCSALKLKYRKHLKKNLNAKFIYPKTSYRVLRKRSFNRKHFFNPRQTLNQYKNFEKKGLLIVFNNYNFNGVVDKIILKIQKN